MAPHRERILAAASTWKTRCLVEGRSLFSDDLLWTPESFEELHRHFIDNLDAGEGDFFQKLEKQLEAANPRIPKLAAEMLWVMYLATMSSSMGASTKRDQIRRVWRWSGEDMPEPEDLLSEELLGSGILNPGTAYHTQRWREFAFFCSAMEAWLTLGGPVREVLLTSPWEFGEWLDAIPSSPRRQLRHILLFYLFPSLYEPMASIQHKKKLLDALGGDSVGKEVSKSPRVAMDRAIYEVRRRLEGEHGKGFSFYESSIRGTWLEDTEARSTQAASPEDDAEAVRWFQDRFGDVNVWVYSPGQRGTFWSEFVDRGIAAIGPDETGDLSRLEDRDAIHELLVDLTGSRNPKNDSLALWELSHEMRPGDVILAKSGRRHLHGLGVVEGPYRFDPQRDLYRHVMPVDWKLSAPFEMEDGHRLPIKTLTRGNDFLPYLARLMRRMEDQDGPVSQELVEEKPLAYDLDLATADVFFSVEKFEAILKALRRRKNVILQGPPGVGKTYVARRLAWTLIGAKKSDNVQMVQFHESYSYEDFVQGWRPNAQGGFELRDGVFLDFCQRAREHPEEDFVFLIDEINRGNLSRILGELLMLIEGDKRGPSHAIPLTYSPSGERFSVPENLYVLGMMNTADRSLAMVDYALRRRFAFFSIPPAFGSEGFRNLLLREGIESNLLDHLDDVLGRLNESIRADKQNLGPGFEIGHSYFVPGDEDDDLDAAWFQDIVRSQIEPLLAEYFFDQPGKVDELLSDLLVDLSE